ncbi:hypothetical protein BMJ13_09310, partial [Staphylococcus saprophyticus]
ASESLSESESLSTSESISESESLGASESISEYESLNRHLNNDGNYEKEKDKLPDTGNEDKHNGLIPLLTALGGIILLRRRRNNEIQDK